MTAAEPQVSTTNNIALKTKSNIVSPWTLMAVTINRTPAIQ